MSKKSSSQDRLGLHIKFLVRHLTGKYHLKILSIDGEITIKLILKERGKRSQSGSVRLKERYRGGNIAECNKRLASKKGR
jgi:hypothetical protein